ncbi:HlyD family secretion protein [Psychromonas sp. MME2]|uniref:HlyD family secretion protein n=1 Tax=Psychromonas sp. MME2 TaxID=3231033 RepID=UPI00339C4DE2
MATFIKQYRSYLLTGSVLLIAVLAFAYKYYDYINHPWTRDGQVRAKVIQIAPRVSGEIITLPIKNNQFVKAGELLFEIDPRTFDNALAQATAQLDSAVNNYNSLIEQIKSSEAHVNVSLHAITQANANIDANLATIAKNKAEYQRQQELLPQKATSLKAVQLAKANYEISIEQKKSAEASLSQANATLLAAKADLAQNRAALGAMGEDNAKIRAARAAVEQAKLNLQFTKVIAPVDGYVTNLNLRISSQVVANQPIIAFVDVNSYWISGFFKENSVGNMCPGNRAVITLMSYPDTPIEGVVTDLGWGIAQQTGSTGFELLPTINPTFEWIRLAQRIPVNIKLLDIPENVALRVGSTASVLVFSEPSS